MTDRLTDDEIEALHQFCTAQLPKRTPWVCLDSSKMLRLLDEIEERRRRAVAASRVVVWARALANDPNACVEDLAAAVKELDDAERNDGGA